MIREGLLEANRKGEIEIKGADPLDRFYLLKGEDYIILKKVEESPVSQRFEELIKETQDSFKKLNIRKSDVAKAIKWARKS